MPDLFNYTPVPCIKKLLSTVLKLILIYASYSLGSQVTLKKVTGE